MLDKNREKKNFCFWFHILKNLSFTKQSRVLIEDGVDNIVEKEENNYFDCNKEEL